MIYIFIYREREIYRYIDIWILQYIYIYIYIYTRLETLIELKCIISSLSNSDVSIRALRAYPLAEIIQTVPCRAIRGKSSDSRQQYLSQQYPPPPSVCRRCTEGAVNLETSKH